VAACDVNVVISLCDLHAWLGINIITYRAFARAAAQRRAMKIQPCRGCDGSETIRYWTDGRLPTDVDSVSQKLLIKQRFTSRHANLEFVEAWHDIDLRNILTTVCQARMVSSH
jgi:hypothetical protein